MNKKIKKTLLITGILLLLIFVTGLVLPGFVEKKLDAALKGEFLEQTDQKYALRYSAIKMSFWGQTVFVDSINIVPQTETLEIKHLSAASVSIDGIEWLSLLRQRFPVFESVTVESPRTELYPRRISSDGFTETAKEKVKLDSLNISTFDIHIRNGTGAIIENDGDTVFSLKRFDIEADDVNLNIILAGTNVPYLNNLLISGKGLYWNLDEKLYSFKIDEFDYDKILKQATVKNLSFDPIVEKYRFAEIYGHQIDRINLSIPEINILGLDLDSLAKPSINLSSITIDKASLEIFHDKHVPSSSESTVKPLLNDIAHKIDFPFGIEEIKVTNANIRYGEHLPASEEPGYVTFNKLNAIISDFRSASHPRFYRDSLTMNVQTRFMNAADMKVNVRYATFDKQDTHHLKATLYHLDGTVLNPLLINLAFMEIESGDIRNMNLDMVLNDQYSVGHMRLRYDNLKINIRDRDKVSNTNFRTRLSSFLVNNFVMKSSNTGEDIRIGEINFERPDGKAIFGYWWKATQQGLENSIK